MDETLMQTQWVIIVSDVELKPFMLFNTIITADKAFSTGVGKTTAMDITLELPIIFESNSYLVSVFLKLAYRASDSTLPLDVSAQPKIHFWAHSLVLLPSK